MRKIIVFSIILFFCLTGFSLTQEKIKWIDLKELGRAPLYWGLDSPEKAKSILIAHKEAVRRAIADDFIHQTLYSYIEGDEIEIEEALIFPGQEILWMLYAGKKAGEVRMLEYLKWSGEEPVEVYIVYIPYKTIRGKDLYECHAEFILPKPCGNISFILNRCVLVEPEHEPEPEPIVKPKPRPKPKPPPLPRPTTPRPTPRPTFTRIKFRNVFRIEPSYFIPMFSLDLPLDTQFSRDYEWLFEEWSCWTRDGNKITAWTNLELKLIYQQYGIESLQQSRKSTMKEIGIPVGVEIGISPVRNFFLTGSYERSPLYQSDIVESHRYFYFEEFNKIADGEYEMVLNEFSLIQETNEKFFFQAFQAGFRVEIPVYEITRIFISTGANFLKMSRRLNSATVTKEFMLFSENEIGELTETAEVKEDKWISRIFVGGGMIMDLIQHPSFTISLGGEGKYFFFLDEKEIEYNRGLLFQGGNWIYAPKPYSIRIFAGLSF